MRDKRFRKLLFGFVVLVPVVASIGCGGPNPNVTTQHNDNFRTGAYLAETTLTPQRVAKEGMRVRYWLGPKGGFLPSAPPGQPVETVEGGIYTQLLYLRQVQFPRETSNALYAGTASAKLYALNADTGAQEWVRNLVEGDPDTCRIARTLDTTPVIDVARHRIFTLFSTQAGGGGCAGSIFGNFPIRYFLGSLDLSTGAGFFTKVEGRDPRSGFVFNEQTLNSHPALLLDHNSVFIAFGSDATLEGAGATFQGWIMRYNADDLRLQNVLCLSPMVTGAGVWQGGGGLAADGSGNVYFLTGNGTTDFRAHPSPAGGVQPSNHLYGDAFLKLAISGTNLIPTVFALEAGCGPLCAADADLGSGGAMVVPDSNRVIGGGKTGVMYVLDRNSMAPIQQFDASTNEYHPFWRGQDWSVGPHLHGSPTYWRGPDSQFGNLYVWGEKDRLKLYRYDTTRQEFETAPLSPKAGVGFGVRPHAVGQILALPNTMPGGMLSLSADGNKRDSGIIWATLPVAPCLPSLNPCWQKEKPPFPFGVYAFHAETLKLLWNDATFSAEGPHWAPPTIADGKVFVPWGAGMIVVYELCQGRADCIGGPTPIQPAIPPAPPCQGCHSMPFQRSTLVYTPLRERYPSEGAVVAYPKVALQAIAPPQQASQAFVLNGEGAEVYQAQSKSPRQRLEWRFRETTAALREFDLGSRPSTKRALHLQIDSGMKLSAEDGSTATLREESTAAAPETGDARWELFRLDSGGRSGVLESLRFMQRVYTVGGGAPKEPPKYPGEIARVPYRAQFRMYR